MEASVTCADRKFTPRQLSKAIRNVEKMAAQLRARMKHVGGRQLRLFAHRDFCLYLDRWPRIDYRYLVKKGEKRGFLVVQFLFLKATIRW